MMSDYIYDIASAEESDKLWLPDLDAPPPLEVEFDIIYDKLDSYLSKHGLSSLYYNCSDFMNDYTLQLAPQDFVAFDVKYIEILRNFIKTSSKWRIAIVSGLPASEVFIIYASTIVFGEKYDLYKLESALSEIGKGYLVNEKKKLRHPYRYGRFPYHEWDHCWALSETSLIMTNEEKRSKNCSLDNFLKSISDKHWEIVSCENVIINYSDDFTDNTFYLCIDMKPQSEKLLIEDFQNWLKENVVDSRIIITYSEEWLQENHFEEMQFTIFTDKVFHYSV